MSPSLDPARQSDPVRLPDNIGPAVPAKASLRSGQSYTAVQHDAILEFYGSVKATAFALGEGVGKPRLDESLMQREFKAGNFDRFNGADPHAKAFVTAALQHTFGVLSSPKDDALRSLDRMQLELNTVRHFVVGQEK